MIRIQIQNQQDDVEITRQLKGYIKKGIRAALKEEGFTRGDVSVLLCDEPEHRKSGQMYTNKFVRV